MNMNHRGEEVIVEENEIDKISNLPKDILYEIFKDISFRELAKTCVLSKKWKYFWTMHPNLVLDREFLEEISDNRRLIDYDFYNIVDNILLQHVGSIVKFVLDLSNIFCDHRNLDQWLLNVTSKDVKEFTLNNHNHNPYTLPSYIFDCSNLTYLSITNCVVNPPYPTTLFPNLLELNLDFITLDPTIANHALNTPLLLTLTFSFCEGLHFLNIFAPKIEVLTIHESHQIHANFFENFSNVRVLCMVIFLEASGNYELERFITWSRLLCVCSNLTRLALSNACITLLGADIIPKRFPSKPYLLEHVKLRVEFGFLNQVASVLSLIRCSPTLRSLEIDVFYTSFERSTNEVKRYLEDPNCVDKQFEKLECVKLTEFEGKSSELSFLKLMLAYSPSLSKMIVGPSKELTKAKVLNFYEQLMMFSKASSPKVELIVAHYGANVYRTCARKWIQNFYSMSS